MGRAPEDGSEECTEGAAERSGAKAREAQARVPAGLGPSTCAWAGAHARPQGLLQADMHQLPHDIQQHQLHNTTPT